MRNLPNTQRKVRRALNPAKKIQPDKSNFITTLRTHGLSEIKCRTCKAVKTFAHNPLEDYITTEKNLREFKRKHGHELK